MSIVHDHKDEINERIELERRIKEHKALVVRLNVIMASLRAAKVDMEKSRNFLIRAFNLLGKEINAKEAGGFKVV